MLVFLCGNICRLLYVQNIVKKHYYRWSEVEVDMSFWLAIVIIVSVGSATEISRQYFKKRESGANVSEQKLDELMKVIEKHESRLSNLETVILELDRDKKYDNL